MPSTPIWSPLSMLVFCFMDTFRRGKVIQCCRMGSAAPWDSQDSRPVPSPISAASVASPSRPLPEERLAARRKIKDFLSSQTAGNAEDPPVATAVAQCALQPAKPRWPTSSAGSPSCEAPFSESAATPRHRVASAGATCTAPSSRWRSSSTGSGITGGRHNRCDRVPDPF